MKEIFEDSAESSSSRPTARSNEKTSQIVETEEY